MMKYSLLISLLIVLSACSNNPNNEKAEEGTIPEMAQIDTSSADFNEVLINDTLIEDELGKIKINWAYQINNEVEITQEYLVKGVQTIKKEKDRILIFQLERNNQKVVDTLDRYDFATGMQEDFVKQGQLSNITFMGYDANFDRVLFFVKFGISANDILFDAEYRLGFDGKSEIIFLEME